MKSESSFRLLAAAILAGVVVCFADLARSTNTAAPASAPSAASLTSTSATVLQ